MDTDITVDEYFARATRWREESERLRAILLNEGLEEALKWGKPCYAAAGENVAIIQKFNPFVAVLFFKGALLKDPDKLLESQGENTRAALRLTFTTATEVDAKEAAIRALIRDAIRVAEAGLTVPKNDDLDLCDELQERLDADPDLKAAFESLTPGRQRHYNIHISGAKQAKTRVSRLDKCAPLILAGKGLRD